MDDKELVGRIREWHTSGSTLSLREFLGMSESEYASRVACEPMHIVGASDVYKETLEWAEREMHKAIVGETTEKTSGRAGLRSD